MMQVRKLEKNNSQDTKVFKALPFQLYENNSFWVPPFPGEIETVMHPDQHPYYQHSEADFFIVEHENKVLGRIAVLYNHMFCEFHNVKTGFFYYFESANDIEVATLLFQAAEEWCKARGLDTLIGPKGFLRSNGNGLLVDGFDQLPAVGIPYNLDYYASLVEANGFEKSHDHLSGYLDRHPNPKIHKIAEKVLSRGNFHIQHFYETSEIVKWVPRIDEVQQKAFSNNPNFYPSTPAEFDLLAKNIIDIADPRFMKVILHDNDVAGFLVAYPNINRALQKSKGKLFPFGWIFLLHEKKNPTILDINGVGLLPEFQGLGGNALLYAELDNITTDTRIKKAEIVQVDERNLRSKSDMESMGVRFSKIHRTYFKKLT